MQPTSSSFANLPRHSRPSALLWGIGPTLLVGLFAMAYAILRVGLEAIGDVIFFIQQCVAKRRAK